MHSNRLHRLLRIVLLFVSVLGMQEVAVADSPAGHIYLSGEVIRQGAIEMPADGKLTVTQAIIMDGGLVPSADKQNIKILRRNSDGTSQFIHVDWVKIMGDGPPDHPGEADLGKDIALEAGDTIIVSKRLINY